MRSLAGLVVALSVALLAAGCGGGAGAGAGGEAAAVVPADVGLYVSVDTDFDGEQWDAASDLVRRFPDGPEALQDVLAEFEEEEGLDFEQDVKPALGPETAFALLDLGDEDSVVGLTQPEDEQKLEQLLEQGDEPTVTEDVEGWTVVANTQDVIDRFKQLRGQGMLADSDGFAEAMDGLDTDALATLYVSGEGLQEAAESDPEFDAEGVDAILPGGRFPSIGAVARADDDGARLHGQAVFAGDVEESALAAPPYEAQLPELVPAGVLAYGSFNDLEQQFSAFRDALAEANPEFESQLGQAEAAIGVSLEEDIGPLFAGEGAVYVRRGAPIPEITLLTAVENEQRAVATVDDLVAGLQQYAPVPDPQETDIGGVQAREVQIQPPFSLFYAAFDGNLVLTTSRQGIVELREGGDSFADQEGFSDATERADMPDETTGWLYVDLQEALPLLLDFASAAGDVPPEARANTEPLRSLVAYGTADGNTAGFTLFLSIE